MFDSRTKIMSLIGVAISFLRSLFPQLIPDGLEQQLDNIIGGVFFLVAFFMRSAISKVAKQP